MKSEITKTRYDSALVSSLDQTHLRNRIAAVSFYPTDVNDYQSATHYSYDIHGNVKRLVQEIPDLNLFGRQFTTLDYEYDLISGNVNAVWFQKGELEQFAHRYRYDADNRITHVYTSNLFKKNDTTFLPQERLEARYFYLPDGAMSRVELGHKQIQGIDYAYTLQGWLKDINGYRSLFSDVYDLLSGYDMGNDGSPVTGNLNSVFPWDAFSSSIQYYQGDYQPVVGTNYFNCPSTSAVPLYNGNISALTTSYHNSTNVVLMKLFRYDKLNRIKQMQTAEQFQSTSGWEPVSDNYSTEYEYDWNGNLLSLRRNDKYGQIMHDIAYHYPNAANNRLGSITATGLNSGSYQYDAIGNLVRDNAEGLAVEWNAMGKVDSICRNGHLLSRFRYSPTGQRQVKMADGDTVFYIHDATGNVMCVYQLKNDTLSATERYMYGGKRLGMFGQQVWIVAGGTAGMSDSSTIGARTYELTDHLGNVTATILDRKRPVLNSYGNMVYIPLIVSYTDYYPFGYPISDRSYYNGGYRYFFNGQEGDGEVYGSGSLHAFEYRMHDTRIGRFWSVDPLAGKFPWNSTYAFAENSPIGFLELEGLETKPLNPQPFKMENISYSVTFPSDNTKVATTYNPWPQTNPCGEIKEPKPLSQFELWLEAPAYNFDQYFIKGLFNFGYGLINAPYTMVFNKTIAGASVTPPQRMDALVSTAPSVVTLEIKFSGYFLKTGFETGKGLMGYNAFVKKSKEIGTFPKQINLPPNLKWQTEVGRQFKVNELNYQVSEESTKFLQGISILDSYRQVELKEKNGNNNQQK